MATLTGQLGQVKIGNDSAGAETAIAEVRSWTVEHTKEVIENTAMGDTSRTYLNGLLDFTGSMEVIYDTGHTAATKAFSPESNDDLFVDFITSTASGSQKFSGQVIVTSVSRTASYDDLITATVNFQGTGGLTAGTIS
jgi:predicted secreted protein